MWGKGSPCPTAMAPSVAHHGARGQPGRSPSVRAARPGRAVRHRRRTHRSAGAGPTAAAGGRLPPQAPLISRFGTNGNAYGGMAHLDQAVLL